MVWLKRLGWIGLGLGILAAAAFWLWWQSHQSPEFYRVAHTQIVNPVERKQVAKKFVRESQQLVEKIKTDPHWSHEFSDAQINAWLIEEFPGELADWIPKEVSQPRVSIQKDGLRLGVKVDQAGSWNGILSVHVNVQVTGPNELAIEIKSVKAGLVAVPLQTVIDQISAHARENGIDIEWRRDGEHQSAIVHLKHEGPESPQLEQIEFGNGKVVISGSSPPKTGTLQFVPRL